MRITSSAVLSLLTAMGMAAPAAENGASIIARDDEEPAQPVQPGQPQLPPDSIGCGFGPAMRIYSQAQADQVAAFACRMTPNNMPGGPSYFPNVEGIQFGTPQNEALFEFPIGNSFITGPQGPWINPYNPVINPPNFNPPNMNLPNTNPPNTNPPNTNPPNFNNPNFNNPNFNNPNFNNPNFNNPNFNNPNVSPDRVVYDRNCQAVGVITQVNTGAGWGQFWGPSFVACTNGIFGAGDD